MSPAQNTNNTCQDTAISRPTLNRGKQLITEHYFEVTHFNMPADTLKVECKLE